MKTSSLLWIPVLTSLTGSACVEAKKEKVQKPNVLLIYADDIGYGDLSCNGGHGNASVPIAIFNFFLSFTWFNSV